MKRRIRMWLLRQRVFKPLAVSGSGGGGGAPSYTPTYHIYGF